MIRLAALAAIALGAAFAQTAAPQAAGGRRAHRMQRLAQELNLTADQKAQARDIFRSGAQQARPLAQQMRQAKKQLQADAVNNAPQATLEQDAASIGPLASQLAAMRAATFGKFYSLLTPEQKAKWSELRAQRRTNRS